MHFCLSTYYFKLISSLRSASVPHCSVIGVSQSISYSGGFVNGVCSYLRRFIAAQSNDKRVLVWSKSSKQSGSTSTASGQHVSSCPIPTDRLSSATCSVASRTKPQPDEYNIIIDESDLFIKGPSGLPYNRRGRSALTLSTNSEPIV